MKVVVTGGAGFIGSHLCQMLAQLGHEVHAFDDVSTGRKTRFDELRKHGVHCEIRDLRFRMIPFWCGDADAIIHLAARAGVRPSMERAVEYCDSNVSLTARLLDWALAHGVRFVFASSSTVYGGDAQTPFCEIDQLTPAMSPYGATKQACEMLIRSYQRRGLDAAICRLFSVYGPGLRPDLAMTRFAQALHGDAKVEIYGDGSIKRDFTHVRDVCRGLIAACDADLTRANIFNLGSGNPKSVRYLADVMCSHFGRSFKDSVEFLEGSSADMNETNADLTRSRAVLGYHPKWGFEQGVGEFCGWYKATH